MFSTPAGVLLGWLRNLFTLFILAGGIWLVVTWYQQLPGTEVVSRPVAVLDRVEDDASLKQDADSTKASRRLRPLERVSAWRPGFDRATAMLVGGACLFLFSFAGRLLNPFRLFALPSKPLPELPPPLVQRITQPDGTEIHIEIRGPAGAPTVILTHGWSLSSQQWIYLQHQWGDRFRTVVWDLPGLGKSTQPRNRDFSLEKMARDLRSVLEATSPGPAILVGHSIGGMIILTFCGLFPGLLGTRVSKLVLVHTSYMNPLRTMLFNGLFTALQKPVIEPMVYLQIALSPLVKCMNWMSYWNGSIHNSVALNGFCGRESRSMLDFIARYSLPDSPAVLGRGTLGMLEYDARQTLPTINIPVLVVAADNDPVTLASASEKMHADLPNSQLISLKAAKHYGLLEHDAEFARVTAEFCS